VDRVLPCGGNTRVGRSLDRGFFARDAFVDAALALTHTTELKVGLGIALPTRSPLQTARAAASLGEFGGRFRLGFAVGHSDTEGLASLRFFQMVGAGAMESAHGIPFHPPLARLRDYLDCVLGLLYAPADEPVNIERTHFRARGKGFGYSPTTLPLLLGGMGPRMCELAGMRADGIILHHMAPRKLVAERAALARAAYARTSAPLTSFVTAFGLIASIDRDERLALRRARAELAGALILPEYLERLNAVDPSVAEQVQSLLRNEQYAAAAEALPEEMVRDMVLVSTPTRFRRDVEDFKEVELVLTLPCGIFAPMLDSALGLGTPDWRAARANLIEAIFGSALQHD